MTLEIKYENGSMTVHLEQFLGCRSISKVRKLVKIIQRSYTPDEINKILNYIEQFKETYEIDLKTSESKIIGYESKVKIAKSYLDKSIMYRGKCTRNSSPWKYHNNYVKQYREELKKLQQLLREENKILNNLKRNKKFYDDCLIVLQG